MVEQCLLTRQRCRQTESTGLRDVQTVVRVELKDIMITWTRSDDQAAGYGSGRGRKGAKCWWTEPEPEPEQDTDTDTGLRGLTLPVLISQVPGI